MRTYLLILAAAGLGLSARDAASQARAKTGGLESITAADVRRRIFVIADDSMGGRDTPSRGLDLTARYVANEFRRMGLKPAGSAPDFISTYRIFTRHIAPTSTLTIASPGGASATLPLGTQVASLMMGTPPIGKTSAPLVLVGGTIGDQDQLDPALTRGKALLFVGDWSQGMPKGVTMVGAATLTNQAAFALLAVPTPAPNVFGLASAEAAMNPLSREGASWFIATASDSALRARVAGAAEQFASAGYSKTMVAEPLDGWTATIDITATDGDETSAPNVAAMIEGSDPELKDEYVVVSGHSDHVGRRCGGLTPADSICNGADDDASGTVGVLEIAEAFATQRLRPKRSVIFLVISGEERGLWGSDLWAGNPPVPINQIVANLNMDMIGRNWKDTVVVIGREHSNLGDVVDRVVKANPTLGLTPVGDQWPSEGTYYRSDHFHFARRGVPILFFTSGFHPDYHRVTDSPDKIDTEKMTRIVKLLYLTAQAAANQPARPQWNPASFEKIVEPSSRR